MDVLMPQLGETVAEGKITKWFKSAGDAIKPGDNLFEIETDKVSMEVPATGAGVLAEIRVPEGEVAPVGAIVAVISDGTGAVASPQAAPKPVPVAAPKPAPVAAAAAPAQPVPAAGAPIPLDPFFEVRTPARNYGPARLAGGTRVSPLARRLAAEAGIDLGKVSPSGPHGRIVARDVETAAHAAPKMAPRAALAESSKRRADQGALPRRAVHGSAARRHAQDHRRAAASGEADHSAFLSDRGCDDRPAPQAARGSERGGAQGPGRQSRFQAVRQRPRHQGLGGGAAARAGSQRGLGGGSDSALRALPTSASRSRSTAG